MNYELSLDAIGDIDEVIDYTLERWGEDEEDKYVGELRLKLDAIRRGEVIKSKPLDEFPDLYMSRFRHHLIYFQVRAGKIPLIMRILLNKRDIASQLEKTLTKLNQVMKLNLK